MWGTNGTARELLADDAPPVAVGAMRLALGGLLLLAWRRPALRGWPSVPLALAVAAMAAYQPLFFSGIDRAGVAVGTVVGIGASPVAGGLLARVVRGEQLGRRWWAATTVGLAGAALLGAGGGDDAGDDVAVGLALAAGAGVAYAVYVAASASLLDRGEPDDVAAVVLGLAGVVLVPVVLAGELDWVTEPGGVALAAWLAVVTVAVAYPLLARGLAAVGVSATATLTLAEPATAAVLGIAVVGERLSAIGWLGLALVIAAVVALRRGDPVRQGAPRA
jgi:DME family drug/metabolite transporter